MLKIKNFFTQFWENCYVTSVQKNQSGKHNCTERVDDCIFGHCGYSVNVCTKLF